jgi:hypothetical protein
MITELALLLQKINQEETTYNPYNKLINRIAERYAHCGQEEIKLYKLLVHGITLLNKLYRIQIDGRYVVERQDMLTALELMGESINPYIKVSKANTEYYHAMFKLFGNRSFKRKAVEKGLLISKTHTNRILEDLEKKGLLIKSGYKNTGYRYEIILDAIG